MPVNLHKFYVFVRTSNLYAMTTSLIRFYSHLLALYLEIMLFFYLASSVYALLLFFFDRISKIESIRSI